MEGLDLLGREIGQLLCQPRRATGADGFEAASTRGRDPHSADAPIGVVGLAGDEPLLDELVDEAGDRRGSDLLAGGEVSERDRSLSGDGGERRRQRRSEPAAVLLAELAVQASDDQPQMPGEVMSVVLVTSSMIPKMFS